MAGRFAVATAFIERGEVVSQVLEILEIPRSTWYAHSRPSSISSSEGACRGRPVPGFTINRDGRHVLDSTILDLLKNYRERPEFRNAVGVDKLYHYLKRDHGLYVNRKKIYRLCRENGLLLKFRRNKKAAPPRRISRNHTVTAPNQL